MKQSYRRFGLRHKLILYLLAVHVALAATAIYAFRATPVFLLLFELAFAGSLLVAFRLVRALFAPLELLEKSTELIAESDYSSRIRAVGQPEMDALIAIFNRMLEALRAERLRGEEGELLLVRILEASPAGLVTLDFDGRITMVSTAAASLLEHHAASGRELLGRTIPDALGALAAIPVGESAVVAIAGQRRLKVARGEFLDRGFRRGFFVLSEVTEELRSSEKSAYQKLIRLMSHEVNNSVGGVRSLLESVALWESQIGEANRAAFGQALSIAIARLDALNGFMGGFAEVARLPHPRRRATDVALLVDELVRAMAPELDRRRIVCAWQSRDSLPPVDLDPELFERALVNVLRNACEAIGENGRVDLDYVRDRGRPLLTIRDTGQGLAPEIRELLFTPFFSTKRDGRGLGLTVIREVFDGHDFTYGLEGVETGGARLWVRM